MRKRTTSAQKYEFFTPPTCFPQRKFLLSHGSFILGRLSLGRNTYRGTAESEEEARRKVKKRRDGK